MADGSTVEYIITIKGESGAKTGSGDGGSGQKSGVTPTQNGQDTSGITGKRMFRIAKVVGLAIGNKIATTVINRVSVTTGQSTLQERLNYQYGAMKRAGISALAIVGGVASGNPLAALAGIASLVNWGVDVGIAQMNINTERRVESIGIRQANIRAGASSDRSGKSGY